jgi:signal transduction histidine kinase
MRFLGCDCFFNYFYEEGEEVLRLNCCFGIPSRLVKELKTLPCGSGVCGYAVQNKCRVVAENIQFHDDPKTTALKSLGIRAYACHPFIADGKVIGTLAFGTRSIDRFKQEDLKLMKAVAESVAVSIRRKITEEKLLKQAKQLEDKNRLITDFFINLSHEFKTPLSILKLAAELMDHYIHNGELKKHHMINHINMIKSNANRLTRLVGNLLDMTKVDAGFMSPQMTYLDIVGFLENMVQSIVDFASKRSLTISYYSNAQRKLIYTDSEFIERIVLNLVSNAIKHTPKGGQISVAFNDDKEKVRIAVKDNGEGIPDDKKEIVFDRFRQVNNSLSRSNEGCGIGLALTKSLVELLGGRIWLNSTLGMGSEFTVELPALNIKTDQSINVKSDNLENKIILEFSDINFD